MRYIVRRGQSGERCDRWEGVVVSEQCGGLGVGVPTRKSHGESAVDLADGSDTFEGFGVGPADELEEFLSESEVVEEAFAKDSIEA